VAVSDKDTSLLIAGARITRKNVSKDYEFVRFIVKSWFGKVLK
jgi:hypothetical protein